MSGIFTIDEIKKIAIPIAKKYGVKKLALFGSYARGEQKITSDVDFIIEKGKIQGLEFFRFINNLEDALGVHVDVLTYQSLDDDFAKDVVGNEIVLYEG
ncbi:MAG: nucleotidyltransferase domain-containing protein [Nitrososphaerota archaeon]|jgi:predicted nucleotidyltransferase|nr:nucleotidyltransferase domain-containing protein [Nitrososphaerota archaeon]